MLYLLILMVSIVPLIGLYAVWDAHKKAKEYL